MIGKEMLLSLLMLRTALI